MDIKQTSYCVEYILEKPWMGFCTSALSTSVIVVLIFPYIAYFINWNSISSQIIAIGLLAGACIQLSQLFYFQALSWSQTDTVAAYGNITPILVPIGQFLFFGDILPFHHYIGICILILASVGFYRMDNSLATRLHAFAAMMISCVILSIAFVLEDLIYQQIAFLPGFLLTGVGIALAGLLPIAIKGIRITLFRITLAKLKNVRIFLLAEVLNVMGIGFWAMSVNLGNPSHVAAIETVMPGMVFLLFIICQPQNSHIKKAASLITITAVTKWILVGLMVYGVLLIQ